MVVREASNVTLTCKATGYPEPYVMWQREDSQNIQYNGESGEIILLHLSNNYLSANSVVDCMLWLVKAHYPNNLLFIPYPCI